MRVVHTIVDTTQPTCRAPEAGPRDPVVRSAGSRGPALDDHGRPPASQPASAARVDVRATAFTLDRLFVGI
ncbi:MAG: hypothetical protein ACRDSR_22765 [Pseudonocardiaceae bacterium]